MNRNSDRSQNPPQRKGILKNPLARPPISAPAQKLISLANVLAQSSASRGGRPRDTAVRGATAFRSPPGKISDDSVSSGDLDGFDRQGRRPALEPVPGMSKCQACWKPLGEFEGFILENCQQHIVCKSCAYHAILDAYEVEQKPTCPVESCCAKISKHEIESICAEDQAETTSRDSDSNQKSEKKPTSSDFDDSEEFNPPEDLVLPRANEEMIVATDCHCDKCGNAVGRTSYLDVRKCKMHHKICFECIRATVKISKNLVRCPLYRECKSMMARDEVLQAKYEVKEEAMKQMESPSRSKAKAKELIYPTGLPSRDLWPVLTTTRCSKCSRLIDCLSGIVVQQCNVHSVCVKCVRERIAMNRKSVACPMFISCKATMTKDEVKAFIERFGGPEL